MTQEVASEALPVWRGLTRERYDAMVDAGLLEDAPVELIEGVLVEVSPQGDDHVDVIAVLTRWLALHLPESWIARPQGPLAAGASSVPEPDIAVTRFTPGVRPQTAALVVEVAVTSQRKDLGAKAALYAAAAVTEYWVLDLPRREVVVHTEPGAVGYAVVRRLPWTAPLVVPVGEGIPVDLAALLPA